MTRDLVPQFDQSTARLASPEQPLDADITIERAATPEIYVTFLLAHIGKGGCVETSDSILAEQTRIWFIPNQENGSASTYRFQNAATYLVDKNVETISEPPFETEASLGFGPGGPLKIVRGSIYYLDNRANVGGTLPIHQDVTPHLSQKDLINAVEQGFIRLLAARDAHSLKTGLATGRARRGVSIRTRSFITSAENLFGEDSQNILDSIRERLINHGYGDYRDITKNKSSYRVPKLKPEHLVKFTKD